MKTLYASRLNSLSYVTRAAVAIAEEHNDTVLLKYRGVQVLVTPTNTPEEIAELWEQDSRCEGKGN